MAAKNPWDPKETQKLAKGPTKENKAPAVKKPNNNWHAEDNPNRSFTKQASVWTRIKGK